MDRVLVGEVDSMKARISRIFRAVLGIVAGLLICYCGVIVFGSWFLLPRNSSWSLVQDLGFRAAMTVGCFAIGIGCLFLILWCFDDRDFDNKLQSGPQED